MSLVSCKISCVFHVFCNVILVCALDLLCSEAVNLSGKLCNHFKRGFKCWKRIYELKLFQSALAIDEELSPICLSTALDSRLPHPLCSRLLFPQYGAPVALSPPFFRITVTHRVRLTIHEQYNGVECLTEHKNIIARKNGFALISDTDMFSC